MGENTETNHSNRKEERRGEEKSYTGKEKKITKYDTHWYSNRKVQTHYLTNQGN